MSYSRGSPASVTQILSPAASGHEVLAPPSRRFATDDIAYGQIGDFVSQSNPPVNAVASPISLMSPTAEAQVHRRRPFYRHLGITTRPPKPFRVALEHDECYVPTNAAASGFDPQSPSRDSLSNMGTLEALVQQGGTTICPPHPDEPGPSTWFFPGNKRRAEGLMDSQSANDVAGLPLEVSYRSKAGKRQRLEQWEAKGGFNLGNLHGNVCTKAITDVSMARSLGVEPGVEIMSPLSKKRHAATSPSMPATKWIFKRQRAFWKLIGAALYFPLRVFSLLLCFVLLLLLTVVVGGFAVAAALCCCSTNCRNLVSPKLSPQLRRAVASLALLMLLFAFLVLCVCGVDGSSCCCSALFLLSPLAGCCCCRNQPFPFVVSSLLLKQSNSKLLLFVVLAAALLLKLRNLPLNLSVSRFFAAPNRAESQTLLQVWCCELRILK
ncbi:hypothetical protein BVRB_8g200920 isoform A [Beta vulgaris subsp. vulgaris]|nr:hypothetical protein BVRB_8g200920 isoform A [Beta vulgaris subsp. vulgaris]